ncbi:MAG TPA: nuclear transport factor 2 family protein [Gammaproteobacteria bacterium]|nr:nuclear transport factor 2 family protein [Gammaproteobacteria bacterium]
MPTGSYASAEACETAFYDAFRDGDLASMQHVWGMDGEVTCIHPGRPPLAGRRAVLQSWEEILGATGGVQVRFDCQSRVRGDDLAVHVGIEVIGQPDSDAALVTVTNVYTLTEQGWKLRTHHGGPIHRGASARGPVH